MTLDTVKDFVIAALEASIYVAPNDHGLSLAELVLLGKNLRLHQGEIQDAVNASLFHQIERDKGRLCLNGDGSTRLADFFSRMDPEPRNWKAFESVQVQLRELARQVGQATARLDRSVLVARGEAEGFRRHDLEVAVTVLLLTGRLDEKDGGVGYPRGMENYALPSLQVKEADGDQFPARRREWLAKVLPLVPDILARRTDGRSASIEPLDAFGEKLAALGHAPFSVWWRQTVSELRLADPARMPITITVLAASLAEASLALVVKTAQSSGGSMTKNLPDPPKQWKFDQLAKAAKTGPNPILDEPLFQRCMMLNEIRQRIHAGRLLEKNPEGPHPDTRPEEAREASATLDLLVRRLLDWLDTAKASAASA